MASMSSLIRHSLDLPILSIRGSLPPGHISIESGDAVTRMVTVASVIVGGGTVVGVVGLSVVAVVVVDGGSVVGRGFLDVVLVDAGLRV